MQRAQPTLGLEEDCSEENSRDLRSCLDLARDRERKGSDVSSICLSLYRVETNLARNSSPFKSPGTEHNTGTLYQEGALWTRAPPSRVSVKCLN